MPDHRRDGAARGDGESVTVLAQALRPRYVDAPTKAGLYESLYFTAHHPAERTALWVRYTVLKPPGAPPRGSLWCTWFAEGGVEAAKVSTLDVSTTPEQALRIGSHGYMGVNGAAGTIGVDQFQAGWDFRFDEPEPPMFHLPKPWMYTARFPRTKSLSAAPMVSLGGSLVVDGQPVNVDGWPCSIGHNWGAEHAERWIWIHADAAVEEGPLWLDTVIGRVRLGKMTTPWIANGALSIGGHRHLIGGLAHGVGARVAEHDRGATVGLRGGGIAVDVRSQFELSNCVAWIYTDPIGTTRQVVNSSVAQTLITIRRAGAVPLTVTSAVSAFEFGARDLPFDVSVQPFAE